MNRWSSAWSSRWNRFLFESCDPKIVPILRIGLAILLIINALVWMLDGEAWFSDQGILDQESAQKLFRVPGWSIFWWNSSPLTIQIGLILLIICSSLLLLGIASRWQVACIFLLLVSFHHRNPLICDGEDTVMRLFAFFMLFLPLDHRWSILRSKAPIGSEQVWALRLFQLEMSIIYASNAWNKAQGNTWRDGTALYYVSQMSDVYGRPLAPDFLFDIPWLVAMITWVVLVIEAALPIALWFRPTRKIAIVLGVLLHLGIELSMNLFLFEWIMILGLLSFIRTEEWTKRSDDAVMSQKSFGVQSGHAASTR